MEEQSDLNDQQFGQGVLVLVDLEHEQTDVALDLAGLLVGVP